VPGPKNGSAVSVNPTANTTYTVSVTDANGCTASAGQSCAVVVLPAPNANFDTSSGGYLSNMYSFTDSSGSNIISWSWNFGDPNSTPNTSTQQNPVHTFSGAGTYTVTEIVHNKFGCADTITKIVKVGEGILIPNVFTPDGDGANDVWYIPNSGMKEFHVEIYNRWGEKVWEATADEIRWDGRSSAGKQLSDGTYYYTLHAILKSGTAGKDYSTKGYVTILTHR
jgi:gliding motility-associated-like protein